MKNILSLVAVLLYAAAALWFATSVPPGKIELASGYEAYTNRDYETAFTQILPLAEQGDATARNFLGTMYEFGRGVEKDRIRARMWYSLAINENVGFSQARQYQRFVSDKMGPGEIEQSERMVEAWRLEHSAE